MESHVSSILAKLGILDSEEDHRRILAVLAYLDHPQADLGLALPRAARRRS